MIPRYGEWAKRYGTAGLSIVGVHDAEARQDGNEKQIRAFLQVERVTWPVLMDRYFDVWRSYGVSAWPTVVLIDRDGRVRFLFTGEGHAGEIETALHRLLGVKGEVLPVAPAARAAQCPR